MANTVSAASDSRTRRASETGRTSNCTRCVRYSFVSSSPATSRPQAFRSVILIIATALLSLYACSFVSLLQVHT